MLDPTRLVYLVYGFCGGIIFTFAISALVLVYCAAESSNIYQHSKNSKKE